MTLSVGTRPRVASSAAVPFTSWLRPRFKATWQNLTHDRGRDAAIAAELGFESGERVLASDREPGGEHAVIATDRALYHRADHGGVFTGGWSRLGWERIARVGWDSASGELIITGTDGAASPRIALPLRQRGTIPELALERVTHTRLGQWRLLADGRCGAVIEARRQPGTGELLWSVTYGGNGHPPADLELRARAERAITRLSAEFGALARQGTGLSAVHAAIGRPRSGGKAAAAE